MNTILGMYIIIILTFVDNIIDKLVIQENKKQDIKLILLVMFMLSMFSLFIYLIFLTLLNLN